MNIRCLKCGADMFYCWCAQPAFGYLDEQPRVYGETTQNITVGQSEVLTQPNKIPKKRREERL